mmetsp:Transcript_13276/g.25149  ORF Transcript_13276/g.25149 Transcript_13276/m.25149 type:complete len:186 (-) Transcript_13276:704-1261(-)
MTVHTSNYCFNPTSGSNLVAIHRCSLHESTNSIASSFLDPRILLTPLHCRKHSLQIAFAENLYRQAFVHREVCKKNACATKQISAFIKFLQGIQAEVQNAVLNQIFTNSCLSIWYVMLMSTPIAESVCSVFLGTSPPSDKLTYQHHFGKRIGDFFHNRQVVHQDAPSPLRCRLRRRSRAALQEFG